MQTAVLSREEKGRMIAEKHDQVMRVDESAYKVASQSRDLSYDVRRTEKGWTCSCFDHFYRQVRCKHIIAVEISQQLRNHVRENVIIEPVNISTCSILPFKQLEEVWIKTQQVRRYTTIPLRRMPQDFQRKCRLREDET